MTQSMLRIAGTSLEPLLFWKRNHSVVEAVDFASSTAATLARLGSGGMVAHVGKRPAKLLELYDREGCPSCRKAREALSILDLNAIIHPCPNGGDQVNGIAMFESREIVKYLEDRYGEVQDADLIPGPSSPMPLQ